MIAVHNLQAVLNTADAAHNMTLVLHNITVESDCQTVVNPLQDGLRCTVGVNVAKCPFCEFHVAKEYKRMAPRRGGFTDSLLPTGFSRGGATGQPCERTWPCPLPVFVVSDRPSMCPSAAHWLVLRSTNGQPDWCWCCAASAQAGWPGFPAAQ
jgi:hypothetical protein